MFTYSILTNSPTHFLTFMNTGYHPHKNLLTLSLIALLTSALSAQETSPKPPQISTQELITHLLAQNLGTRSFPFSEVVSAATGKQVIPFQKENPAHQATITAIRLAAVSATNELSSPGSPVRELRRINEASRIFENHFLKQLNLQPNITCSIPRNAQGNQQRSGYPDLLIIHTDHQQKQTHFYLDPKLFEQKSRASSLRTFYYEPRKHTHKIHHHATHLLIGISHDGNQGAWQFTHWEIVDLSGFNVRLKAEFQASNRDIYRPHTVIESSADE